MKEKTEYGVELLEGIVVKNDAHLIGDEYPTRYKTTLQDTMQIAKEYNQE